MSTRPVEEFDVVIAGAGFAGLYALHRMRKLGLSAVVLEAAEGIGGTWYWNAYPGARCDVESFEYSYSFDDDLQQSWRWSERYAKQPEILRYLQHVAERLDLLRDIRLHTRVASARWRDDGTWLIETNAGTFVARYLVMATGCLSVPNKPDIPGIDCFEGTLLHSGRWPQEDIDIAGRRVGVVGTGSSGVQIIGNIASRVGELHVFQRTPHWVAPAGNRPIDDDEDRRVKESYRALREKLAGSLLGMGVESGGGSALDASEAERKRRYGERWRIGGPAFLLSFDDLLFNPAANATACEFLADRIRETVEDRDTAEALIPDAARYPVGARRLVLSDKYYDCFNLPNVRLVDTRRDPIREITTTGITLKSGAQTPLDVIVLATGFDALTGALLKIDIRGRNGIRLSDKWSTGPRSYLGLAVEGFPNLFTLTGPGSPSVFSNVALSIEQHVEFVADLIGWMHERELTTMEAAAESEARWGEKVLEVAAPTVLMSVDSWYWGANVEGKPRAFMPYLGGVGAYRDECREIANAGYTGFEFR